MTRIITAVCLLIATSAPAIVIRHDRDDARYRELGENHPAVVHLEGAMGTLIAPRWIITAAHVAQDLSPFGCTVHIGDADYVLVGRALHPKWKGRASRTSIDIALLLLDRPVPDVTPALPYPHEDELGKTIVVVGDGDTGNGKTGPTHNDGAIRGATNVIDEIRGDWLKFAFDAPPGGTDLEGISGPGDSGGPALLERDSKTYIVGVSSSNSDNGAAGPCQYGSHEFYPRVSTSRAWIESTIHSGHAEPLKWSEPVEVTGDNWPETNAGHTAAALFAALAGDDDAIRAFEIAHRSAGTSADRPLEDRVKNWRRIIDERGPFRPVRFVTGEGDELHVLVAGKDSRTLDFTLLFEKRAPHKLDGVAIDVVGTSPATDGAKED